MVNILLHQSLAYAIHGKYKKSNKNKFKISTPTWGVDILKYIIKNHETVTSVLPIRISINERGNRIGN